MGLGTYALGRLSNAVMVILIATFICSAVFNALMEIKADEVISSRLQEEKQRALGHGAKSLFEYLEYHAPDMERYNVTIEIDGKVYLCSRIFTNRTLMKELQDRGIDILSLGGTCIERYIVAFEKHRWGLDQPPMMRILLYTYRTLTFSLGRPIGEYKQYGEYEDVFSLLMLAMSRSMLLFTIAYLINMSIAIYIGLKMARNFGGILDRGVAVAGMIAHAMPLYWVGLLMILFFSVYLRLFPMRAFESPPPTIENNFTELFKWWSWHLALPIITIVLIAVGPTAYVVRNMVINVLQEDFVMVARAKGLPERYILYRHVLRAASPPIATTILLGLLNTFFGAIISERVFQWPGMGFLYWMAINNGDIVVLMGLNYLFILLFVSIKFFLDILYCFLDPRIKTARTV
ncbi:MAG TPA: ABC transporter permease [Ignisphaera sp.]|nr:ABC transporter permease [Ignisphaera sp.]